MMTDKKSKVEFYQVRFVTTKKYAEISGVSQQRVWNYIKVGEWQNGTHYFKKGRTIFVDILEAEKWMANKEPIKWGNS